MPNSAPKRVRGGWRRGLPDMAHTPYIIAAYVIGVGGLGGMLAWCLIAMHRAERRASAEERQ